MLIKCPECGGNVSDKSTQCIHCGYPISIDQDNEIIGILKTGRKIDATKRIMEIYNLSLVDATAYMKDILEKTPGLKEQNMIANGINPNKPKCPTCGSINVKPITATERAVSVAGLGLMSKKINKTYKCLNCKCTW